MCFPGGWGGEGWECFKTTVLNWLVYIHANTPLQVGLLFNPTQKKSDKRSNIIKHAEKTVLVTWGGLIV